MKSISKWSGLAIVAAATLFAMGSSASPASAQTPPNYRDGYVDPQQAPDWNSGQSGGWDRGGREYHHRDRGDRLGGYDRGNRSGGCDNGSCRNSRSGGWQRNDAWGNGGGRQGRRQDRRQRDWRSSDGGWGGRAGGSSDHRARGEDDDSGSDGWRNR